jgi:hypothetical protein
MVQIENSILARPLAGLQQANIVHGVLFLSGANIKVLQVIQEQHIPALTEGSDGGAYFARDPSRRAPHNLYTDGNRLAQGVSKYAPRVTYVLPSPPVSPRPARRPRWPTASSSTRRLPTA